MSSFLKEYFNEIQKGHIIVGQELYLALCNYIEDMNDKRFIYDVTGAEFRIKFMERFCRLTKSPFYNKPMKLMLWQKAFIECFYSFKWRDTGKDRFQKTLLMIGRKNTKSETCNALAFTELMIGAKGSDIVCSSNNDIQANILYDGIDTMRKLFDVNNLRTKKTISNIVNKRTNTKIFKLTQKTQNKEGRNIDLAILDECFRGDTEILTNKGYKPFYSLNETEKIAQWDNGKIEFVKPLRFIKREYVGDLLMYETGRRNHIAVTPNHVMIFEHGGKIIEKLASDKIFTNDRYILQGCVCDDCKHLTDLEKVIIATQADGSFHYKQRKAKNTWSNSRCANGTIWIIRFSKKRKIERWLEISKNLDMIEMQSHRKDYKGFSYVLPSGVNCKRFCECFDLLEFDYTKAREFIAEIMNWDGHYCDTGEMYYSSIVKENVDFVAGVAQIAGYSTYQSFQIDNRKENHSVVHRLFINTKKLGIYGKTIRHAIQKLSFNGFVYCVEVPSHKIIVRGAGGNAIICGNCHELKNNDIYKAIEQSQSIKENPKLICITTEGFTNGGLLDELTKQCRGIINKEIEIDNFMPWLYTQDSEQEIWQNPKSWQKSNPSLGIVKQRSYLENQLNIARVSKTDRVYVLCKDFNIKQNTNESWLLLEDFSYKQIPLTLETFSNSVVIGGVDLAETTDLTVGTIIMSVPNDQHKYVYQHYWIPRTKLESNNDKSSGAKYEQWAEQELLTICDSNDVDVRLVADWFADLYRIYKIKTYKVGYDNRFARPFLERLDEYGIEAEMVYQNAQTISNPMKILEADFRSKNVEYGNNEILQWCISNTCSVVDNLGRCMAIKINNQPSKRIDGCISLIIAYATMYNNRGEYSNYSEVNKIVTV